MKTFNTFSDLASLPAKNKRTRIIKPAIKVKYRARKPRTPWVYIPDSKGIEKRRRQRAIVTFQKTFHKSEFAGIW